MAEVAHDTSGPPPRPGDIATQQASRSDSPDRGRLRVFISYSRDDLEFADQLDAALNACGFECLIDRHGISGGEDWKRRLGNLIRESDTAVFLLSPTSARSEICDWEVEEAARLGKRIIPVVCRSLEGASPPPQLRERNYIFFHADPKAAPGAGFGTGLANLIAALNTDFDWLREHTRYLQRATEWDRGGRPANRLLSGDDIAEAKAWAARRPKNAPEPTALHLDFIRASEEEAEARSSAQRKQLEAMAAAQAERETALRQAEEAQRKRARVARIRNIALVALSILAVLAGLLGLLAEQQREEAEQQREEAAEQRNILEAATTYMVKSQTEQDEGKKREAFGPVLALFQRGADRGDTFYIRNLALLYQAFGPAQDYTKARELYATAADKGDARAISNLGSLYEEGRGVAQDYTKARELYETAAIKGDARAMFNLGLLYANGWGVAQDYTKAREWWEKAADRGDGNAKAELKAAAGRYEEALALREGSAAEVEAEETKREGKPGEETARALNSVAWLALFAQQFTQALAFADRAHALLPDNLEIETNRAHALMFLERGEDSKALYLAYKGKPLSGQDARLWERVIAEDFAEFRKAGLTHPMMADIEKELGVSP